VNGLELKSALRAGKRVYGTCVVSPSPLWPAMIASTGLDFAFIDTEHIPLERAQVSWMCQTFSAKNVAPIVRIPSPDPYEACKVLDGGAVGVVAPYLEEIQDIQDLRGAVKYRPLKGQRLQRVLSGAEVLDETLAKYLGDYAADKLMVVNIESVPAIEALDDILEVPDIDALLIGPHDLSISLGIPEQYQHPTFTKAITTIIDKGRSRGVGVGFHYSFGIQDAVSWAKAGANFIIHSTDYFLVRDALRHDLGVFRDALGEDAPGTGGDSMVVV
jgi:2-keto-3-deoxy-L-rhamnonate aldolase RhmA